MPLPAVHMTQTLHQVSLWAHPALDPEHIPEPFMGITQSLISISLPPTHIHPHPFFATYSEVAAAFLENDVLGNRVCWAVSSGCMILPV